MLLRCSHDWVLYRAIRAHLITWKLLQTQLDWQYVSYRYFVSNRYIERDRYFVSNIYKEHPSQNINKPHKWVNIINHFMRKVWVRSHVRTKLFSNNSNLSKSKPHPDFYWTRWLGACKPSASSLKRWFGSRHFHNLQFVFEHKSW